MIKFKPKEQAKVSPQRKAAEQLLQQLKRTLEMEAGRGNITIGHFLTSRGSQDRNAFAPRTQPGTGFYTLEGVVATGGMGAVLKAQDNNLARTVALKVMLNSAEANEQTVFSFVAEAQITGQLEHPNIVPLHDIGVAADGTIYYTMKLIEGRTLRDILKDIREGNADTILRFPISRLLTIFQKVCDGIAYAHSRQVVHRDLKPDNVMVGEFGEVLVLDWGLAKVLPAAGEADTEEAGGEFSGPLPGAGADAMATMAGQIKGTPNYMAPEQAEGRVADIDRRSDIYALGGILYCILTMQPPVTGSNLDEILTRVTSGDITSPTSFNSKPIENPSGKVAPHCPDGTIPDALSAVAMKCMAREREARYQSIEELQADIAAYQGGYATRAQDANIFTLMKLLLQRNKKEVFMALGAVVAIFVVILGFLGKVKLSEIKAQDALTEAKKKVEELRQTAPSFATVAEGELRKLQFTNALVNVEQAIKLDGSNANFHNVKGNILTSLQEYGDARKAFERARELEPAHTAAGKSAVVLAGIIQDAPADNKKLKTERYRQLYELMRDQGRTEEASLMFGRFAAGDTKILDTFRANLAAGGIKPELLEREASGEFHLNLSGQKVSSLRALSGIQLTTLSLAGCVEITDLAVLKGMPLTQLNLAGLAGISDLNPLNETKTLVDLNLQNCVNVLDLAPLADLPLKRLNLSGSRATDFKPLKDVKTLEWLDLSRSQARDIGPLAGKPLKWLDLSSSRIVARLDALKGAPLAFLNISSNGSLSDISALAGMPLVTNLMDSTTVRSIAALKGMRLQHLSCYKTPVEDLAPLAKMNSLRFLDLRQSAITSVAPLAGLPLDILRLADTAIADISPLQGAPLSIELDLSSTRVANLDSLRGAPLQFLNLAKTQVASVAPLAGMPLKVLRLDGLPTQPDLNPLWECQELEQLSIPPPSPSIVALRQLPKLKRLDYYVPLDEWGRAKTPVVFWKEWDARK